MINNDKTVNDVRCSGASFFVVDFVPDGLHVPPVVAVASVAGNCFY